MRHDLCDGPLFEQWQQFRAMCSEVVSLKALFRIGAAAYGPSCAVWIQSAQEEADGTWVFTGYRTTSAEEQVPVIGAYHPRTRIGYLEIASGAFLTKSQSP